METIITKSLITAVLSIILIITGILLRKKGEPYKTGIFTVHKLSVVGSVIFVILVYNQHFKLLQFDGFGWFMILSSGLFFILAFITGALLSFEKLSSYRLKIVHRALSWLTILFIPVIWLVCH